MKNKPIVSVIMGSYNPQWDKLRRGVESLRRQTFQDWELVLWDDGSSQEGAMALEQAASLDPRVRLYHGRENRGLGFALNRCVQKAGGKYLARMDDDDVSFPHRLEIQARFLDTHPQVPWVGSSALLLDKEGPWGRLDMPRRPTKLDFLAHSPYIHPSVMFRREVLENGGGYSQSQQYFGCEDYELFFRLHAQGYRGYNLSVPLLGYWEDGCSYQKRTPSRRLREARLRWIGCRQLGLPVPLGAWSVLRPLAAAMVPWQVLWQVKRRGSASG